MKDKTVGYIMAAIAWLGALSFLLAIFLGLTTPAPKTYPVATRQATTCELRGGENAVEVNGRCYNKKGRELK